MRSIWVWRSRRNSRYLGINSVIYCFCFFFFAPEELDNDFLRFRCSCGDGWVCFCFGLCSLLFACGVSSRFCFGLWSLFFESWSVLSRFCFVWETSAVLVGIDLCFISVLCFSILSFFSGGFSSVVPSVSLCCRLCWFLFLLACFFSSFCSLRASSNFSSFSVNPISFKC